MKRFIAITIFIFIVYSKNYGQVGFLKVIEKPFTEFANDIVELENGNYLILATSFDWSGDNSSVIVIELNKNGELVDEYSLEIEYTGRALGILKNQDTYSILYSYGSSDKTINYMINSSEIWSIDNKELFSYPYKCFFETDDIIIFGGNAGLKSAIAKLSLDGSIIWVNNISTGEDSYCESVVKTTNDTFIAICSYSEVGHGNYGSGSFTHIIDKNGEFVQSYKEEDFFAKQIISTKDNNYLICGNSNTKIVVRQIRYDNSIIFEKHIGTESIYEVECIVRTKDDCFMLAGSTNINGYDEIYLAKIDSKGNLIFDKVIESSKESRARNIIATSDGGFLIVGETLSYEHQFDIIALKVNANGNLTEIKEKKSSLTHFRLFQNYPNPFNPTTTIEYSIPELSNVRIDVFNVLGQKIITLVNEQKLAGNYKVQFNATATANGLNLASGVYYYKIKTDSYSEIKKMCFIK